jgi:stress response protein YsnF
MVKQQKRKLRFRNKRERLIANCQLGKVLMVKVGKAFAFFLIDH